MKLWLTQGALTLIAEAVTSQDRLALQEPTLKLTTNDFRSEECVVVLLSDPSATEGGDWGRQRQR
jgi:hypothetical protein